MKGDGSERGDLFTRPLHLCSLQDGGVNGSPATRYRGKQINPHYCKSKEDANNVQGKICIENQQALRIVRFHNINYILQNCNLLHYSSAFVQ